MPGKQQDSGSKRGGSDGRSRKRDIAKGQETPRDSVGNWGTSDSDGQFDDGETSEAKGSGRERAPIESYDDEDAAFDGYNGDAPHLGKRSQQ